METIKLTDKEFSRLRLTNHSNKVLVKKLTENQRLKTKFGIYVLSAIYMQNELDHIDRVFEIIKQPDRLKFVSGEDNYHTTANNHSYGGDIYFKPPMWKTIIETKPGDIVISSKRGAGLAIELEVGEDKYYLIDYHDLYIAFTPGKPEIRKILNIPIKDIKPLNGYIICESVEKKKESKYIILLDEKDSKVHHGTVKHIGCLNQEYYTSTYSDYGADVRPGHEVRKRNSTIHRDLENISHAVFENKQLFVIQRKDIVYYKVK